MNMQLIRNIEVNTFFIVQNGLLLSNPGGPDLFDSLEQVVDYYSINPIISSSNFKYSELDYKHYPHLFELIIDFDDISELNKLKDNYPELFI